MSSTEALRRWLADNADRYFGVALADVGAILYGRVAVRYLLKEEHTQHVIGVVEGPDAGVIKFSARSDGWPEPIVAERWKHRLVDAILADPPADLEDRSPSLNKSRTATWIADHGDLARRIREAPREVLIRRADGLGALMDRVCAEIDHSASQLVDEKGHLEAGKRLSGKDPDWQNQLLRLLRAHAVLAWPGADRLWRREALSEIAKGHGFFVEVYSERPSPQPISRGRDVPDRVETAGLRAIAAVGTMPMIEHINRLISGVLARESVLHEWFDTGSLMVVKEVPAEFERVSPDEYVKTEGGILVKRKDIVEKRRRDWSARFDLLAIAALAIPQLESAIHQAAHASRQRIPRAPKPLVSLRGIEAKGTLDPALTVELTHFFREGIESPRYRFAHGATGSLFANENVTVAIEATRLLDATMQELERRGLMPQAEADWWHASRGLSGDDVEFVGKRAAETSLGVGNPIVDHVLDLGDLSGFLAPEDEHLWRLASSRSVSTERRPSADWAWAHLVFPLGEALLRSSWQAFGYSVVKIKRSNGGYRYSPALLNPAELLSAEILQRFYPAATRHGPDSRLVGLLQRIRDGLLHGEGTSLGIPSEHCLKLAVYAIGAITYKCGLKPEWQARGGAA